MPKRITLNQFASKGLNSDILPWELPGDYLSEVRNIRIANGRLVPFGGSAKWVDLPADSIPGFIIHIGSGSDRYWIIAGQNNVYSYDGSVFNDISSNVGYPNVSNEDDWSGCRLASIAVINHPGHFPEYWNSQVPATPLAILPWDSGNTWEDVSQRARIIRSHKQFLFALDLDDNGTVISDGVRWSAPADVNGVPPTWDPLDTTNVAGFLNLGGDGGRIIDGLSLRDAFVVYRESGITVFDFIGGQFVWQVRELSDAIGLVSQDTIVEVEGRHYFIGDGDIFVNDGNSITSLLHNRLRDRFRANFDSVNYSNSYAVSNYLASEIWFCVPEAGQVYPNIAYIYNWRDNSWSVRDIPAGPFGSYGSRSSPPVTWADIAVAWNEYLPAWNQSQVTPLDDTVVIVLKDGGTGGVGQLRFPEFTVNSQLTPFSAVIERTGFALEGVDNVTTITRVYPRARGQGSFFVEVGSQDYPGAPVRWKDRVLFDPNNDRKVDIRSTGELHCFRFSTENDNLTWELSGVDIEYVNAGVR